MGSGAIPSLGVLPHLLGAMIWVELQGGYWRRCEFMDPPGYLRRMPRAAWPISRYRLRQAIHLSHWCVLLGLLGALGVLALVVSVVSPDDDGIQQECTQGYRLKQFAAANYRAAREVRTLGTSTVRSALLPQGLRIIHCAVSERVLIADKKILGTIFGNRTGDRSPPTTSS